MFNRIDLRDLADLRGPERAFVSLYASSPAALDDLDRRIERARGVLDEGSDELEHFERNVERIREALADLDHESGALCVFSCWALDYLQGFAFDGEVPDLLRVDDAPYLRPLAELQDEYEDFVVVTADNSETRVFRVTSATPAEEERVDGDVKNHVRKGGWSQQRYARRREDQLLHYARDVVEALEELQDEKPFERLFLLGSDEAMRTIEDELPEPLASKLVGRQAVDLHQDDEVWEAAFGLFFAEERRGERDLWERIKGEVLRHGRAATGAKHVLPAAAAGRVEHLLVDRDAELEGTRCRDCQNAVEGEADACPVCGSSSLFRVDLVEELVQQVTAHHGEVEFSDPIRGLTKAGKVAALLRY